MTLARRIVIRGRVQGVGYRAWLEGEARREGLRGWVRNRRDGTVEALLIGEPTVVERVIDACHHGPRLAAVAGIESFPAEDDGDPGFRVLPTM